MRNFDSDFEQNLYHDRLQTLEKIADIGVQLGLTRAEARYPNHFPATTTIPELRATYDHAPAEEFEAASAEGKPIEAAVAGRIMAIRLQGKAGFAQLQGGGQRLQIYVRKDDVGDLAFALYKLLDLGDHIGVRGHLMRTRTGELTLKVGAIHLPAHQAQPPITFLAKAMLALPDKYHGLEDVELRYRQRYVDLIMNSGTLTKQELPPPSPTSASATPLMNPVILSEGDHTVSAAAEGPRDRTPLQNPSHPSATPLLNPVILSEGDHTVSAAAEGPRDRTPRPDRSSLSPAEPPPGISAVTETAAPNEEHNDAPRNVREVFVKRAAILRSIRRFFDERGYLEVETPMMHTIAGGAAARPFKTHHNALDIPLSLRIAPELYLKRLVVGGLDRVYEINRNFRNEGVSTQHNPEFTMLEFYQAYSNYHDLMDLTQELVTKVATEVNGSPITHFNGQEIDLSKWQRLSMREAIIRWWPVDPAEAPTYESFEIAGNLAEKIRRAVFLLVQGSRQNTKGDTRTNAHSADQALVNSLVGLSEKMASGISHKHSIAGEPVGKGIAELFEILAEPHLIQPTIIYDFPLAVSPLSKQKPDEPDWVERFEFYIGGFEVGNAFSELNDPEEQRKRFEQQLAERDRGDDEAHAMDEDYVRALGYGLPPTAGEGIGIDRLTMLLTGSRSIRDVILFPLMRPQKSEAAPPSANDPQREAES